MSKISLKNILKKTFKKSLTKKKKSISKPVKVKKIVTLKKSIKLKILLFIQNMAWAK